MAATPTDRQSSWLNIPPSRATLSAIYTNTSTSMRSHHHFSHSISTPIPDKDSTSIDEKSKYLADLRTSVKTLQDEVNSFLTQKMEEAKMNVATDRDGLREKRAGGRTMDEVEEENYGEEDVDDDKDG